MEDTGGMSLKQALAANRWLRGQFACLIAVALCVPAIIVFTSAWVFLAFGVFALTGGACWVPARRLEKALEAARVASAQEAAELRTPRAPDAGPDQCPVCGGYGLIELAADDTFMERGERAKVVAWGRKRAHRDCAEFVPYVPTDYERKMEIHKREHNSATPVDQRCIPCPTEDDRRRHETLTAHAKERPKREQPTWFEFGADLAELDPSIRTQIAWALRDQDSAQGEARQQRGRRAFDCSWPLLMAPAKHGAMSIRLDREAIPEYRHWMIAIGPIAHNDILVIESCRRADDGFGWTAMLAEPLRHDLRVDDVLSNKLMPLDSGRLWNREAGRPYTRTELGLCDCWAGSPATRPPRMPADWERLGEEFDREHGWLWPETKGWRR